MIEYILKSIPHGGNFFFLSSGIPIICDFKQAPRLAIPEHTTQVGSRRCPRHPPHSFFLIFFFFMWDLPGPGLEPVSPALAGGFLTTAPPGKPPPHSFSYQVPKL